LARSNIFRIALLYRKEPPTADCYLSGCGKSQDLSLRGAKRRSNLGFPTRKSRLLRSLRSLAMTSALFFRTLLCMYCGIGYGRKLCSCLSEYSFVSGFCRNRRFPFFLVPVHWGCPVPLDSNGQPSRTLIPKRPPRPFLVFYGSVNPVPRAQSSIVGCCYFRFQETDVHLFPRFAVYIGRYGGNSTPADTIKGWKRRIQ